MHVLDLTDLSRVTIEVPDYVERLVLSPDGSLLGIRTMTSDSSHGIGLYDSQAAAYLIDTATGERVATLAESVARVDALAFSQDGASLFVSWGGAVYVWAIQ